MFRGLAAIVAMLLLVAVFVAGYMYRKPPEPPKTTVWHTGPTVTHLETLSHLVTTKVNVADVLMAEGRGYRGSWLIKGDALISVPLKNAKVSAVDPDARTAKLSLPAPEVLSARVDHSRTRKWNVERTTWLPWTGDADSLRDNAMKEAQNLIHNAANSKDNLDHARNAAETAIARMYEMVDWKVTIDWNTAETAKPAATTADP